MDLLKKVGRKIQVGIEKIDGPDPYIPCEECLQKMYNATKKQESWNCDYCEQRFSYEDSYYRLSCKQHLYRNVCRGCARNIQDTPQYMQKYPSQCDICKLQLQDATKLRTDWTCMECRRRIKSTDTEVRFRCYVHNFDRCYNCAKDHIEKLEEQKRLEKLNINDKKQQVQNPPQQQTGFNQPPAQQQQSGFNQPPPVQQQQSGFNQPPVQQQQPGFNQPPMQQQQQPGFNQPMAQQGTDQINLSDSQYQQIQSQINQGQQIQQADGANYNYPSFD